MAIKNNHIHNCIDIEVAYGASSTDQSLIACSVKPNISAKEAIVQSGILTRYPEINLTKQKIGIFGRIVALDQSLKTGDRVEIYRSLVIDPKTARRQRAAKKHR